MGVGVTKTYKVVQWATGTIGARSLRGVVEHPSMSLTGIYVYSPEKAGRDAGELCGLPAIGVTATRDVDDIMGLGADCVLYMPRDCDMDIVCHLLESGANVVTTRGEFHHPASMDPSTRGPRRSGLPDRRHVDPQHRQQSWVHLRGCPAGPDVNPATTREPGHRGVRRLVPA